MNDDAADHLPMTTAIDAMIREGRIDAAIAVHNATVDAVLARAAAGDTINLSDMMASHENLVRAQATRGQAPRITPDRSLGR